MAAFISQPAFFYPHVGHGGIQQNNPDKQQFVLSQRVTGHPLVQQQIQELNSQLDQIKDLPAPKDFIIDCFLWLNALSNDPSFIKTLDALLNNLNAFKTIQEDRLRGFIQGDLTKLF